MNDEYEDDVGEEEKFEAGDTVRLISGGPLMTIIEIRSDLAGYFYCECAWFDSNDTFNTQSIDEGVLEKSKKTIHEEVVPQKRLYDMDADI